MTDQTDRTPDTVRQLVTIGTHDLERLTVDRIVVLDLETTGLDERAEQAGILEIAFKEISRPDIEGFSSVCFWAGDRTALHPVVQKMHTENGLFALLEHAPIVGEVERRALAALDPLGPCPLTLCGDSVHFDYAWLRVHMPRLARRFSHRLLDLSAVKIFLATVGVDVRKNEDESNHRAADDVRRSIARLEAMRAWVRL